MSCKNSDPSMKIVKILLALLYGLVLATANSDVCREPLRSKSDGTIYYTPTQVGAVEKPLTCTWTLIPPNQDFMLVLKFQLEHYDADDDIRLPDGNALKHESDTPCLKFINEPVGVKGNCIIDQIHHTYCSNGETKILDQTNSNPLTLSINTRPTLNNAMVLGSIYEYTQMVVQYSFVKCVAPQTRQGVAATIPTVQVKPTVQVSVTTTDNKVVLGVLVTFFILCLGLIGVLVIKLLTETEKENQKKNENDVEGSGRSPDQFMTPTSGEEMSDGQHMTKVTFDENPSAISDETQSRSIGESSSDRGRRKSRSERHGSRSSNQGDLVRSDGRRQSRVGSSHSGRRSSRSGRRSSLGFFSSFKSDDHESGWDKSRGPFSRNRSKSVTDREHSHSGRSGRRRSSHHGSSRRSFSGRRKSHSGDRRKSQSGELRMSHSGDRRMSHGGDRRMSHGGDRRKSHSGDRRMSHGHRRRSHSDNSDTNNNQASKRNIKFRRPTSAEPLTEKSSAVDDSENNGNESRQNGRNSFSDSDTFYRTRNKQDSESRTMGILSDSEMNSKRTRSKPRSTKTHTFCQSCERCHICSGEADEETIIESEWSSYTSGDDGTCCDPSCPLSKRSRVIKKHTHRCSSRSGGRSYRSEYSKEITSKGSSYATATNEYDDKQQCRAISPCPLDRSRPCSSNRSPSRSRTVYVTRSHEFDDEPSPCSRAASHVRSLPSCVSESHSEPTSFATGFESSPCPFAEQDVAENMNAVGTAVVCITMFFMLSFMQAMKRMENARKFGLPCGEKMVKKVSCPITKAILRSRPNRSRSRGSRSSRSRGGSSSQSSSSCLLNQSPWECPMQQQSDCDTKPIRRNKPPCFLENFLNRKTYSGGQSSGASRTCVIPVLERQQQCPITLVEKHKQCPFLPKDPPCYVEQEQPVCALKQQKKPKITLVERQRLCPLKVPEKPQTCIFEITESSNDQSESSNEVVCPHMQRKKPRSRRSCTIIKKSKSCPYAQPSENSKKNIFKVHEKSIPCPYVNANQTNHISYEEPEPQPCPFAHSEKPEPCPYAQPAKPKPCVFTVEKEKPCPYTKVERYNICPNTTIEKHTPCPNTFRERSNVVLTEKERPPQRKPCVFAVEKQKPCPYTKVERYNICPNTTVEKHTPCPNLIRERSNVVMEERDSSPERMAPNENCRYSQQQNQTSPCPVTIIEKETPRSTILIEKRYKQPQPERSPCPFKKDTGNRSPPVLLVRNRKQSPDCYRRQSPSSFDDDDEYQNTCALKAFDRRQSPSDRHTCPLKAFERRQSPSPPRRERMSDRHPCPFKAKSQTMSPQQKPKRSVTIVREKKGSRPCSPYDSYSRSDDDFNNSSISFVEKETPCGLRYIETRRRRSPKVCRRVASPTLICERKRSSLRSPTDKRMSSASIMSEEGMSSPSLERKKSALKTRFDINSEPKTVRCRLATERNGRSRDPERLVCGRRRSSQEMVCKRRISSPDSEEERRPRRRSSNLVCGRRGSSSTMIQKKTSSPILFCRRNKQNSTRTQTDPPMDERSTSRHRLGKTGSPICLQRRSSSQFRKDKGRQSTSCLFAKTLKSSSTDCLKKKSTPTIIIAKEKRPCQRELKDENRANRIVCKSETGSSTYIITRCRKNNDKHDDRRTSPTFCVEKKSSRAKNTCSTTSHGRRHSSPTDVRSSNLNENKKRPCTYVVKRTDGAGDKSKCQTIILEKRCGDENRNKKCAIAEAMNAKSNECKSQPKPVMSCQLHKTCQNPCIKCIAEETKRQLLSDKTASRILSSLADPVSSSESSSLKPWEQNIKFNIEARRMSKSQNALASKLSVCRSNAMADQIQSQHASAMNTMMNDINPSQSNPLASQVPSQLAGIAQSNPDTQFCLQAAQMGLEPCAEAFRRGLPPCSNPSLNITQALSQQVDGQPIVEGQNASLLQASVKPSKTSNPALASRHSIQEPSGLNGNESRRSLKESPSQKGSKDNVSRRKSKDNVSRRGSTSRRGSKDITEVKADVVASGKIDQETDETTEKTPDTTSTPIATTTTTETPENKPAAEGEDEDAALINTIISNVAGPAPEASFRKPSQIDASAKASKSAKELDDKSKISIKAEGILSRKSSLKQGCSNVNKMQTADIIQSLLSQDGKYGKDPNALISVLLETHNNNNGVPASTPILGQQTPAVLASEFHPLSQSVPATNHTQQARSQFLAPPQVPLEKSAHFPQNPNNCQCPLLNNGQQNGKLSNEAAISQKNVQSQFLAPGAATSLQKQSAVAQNFISAETQVSNRNLPNFQPCFPPPCGMDIRPMCMNSRIMAEQNRQFNGSPYGDPNRPMGYGMGYDQPPMGYPPIQPFPQQMMQPQMMQQQYAEPPSHSLMDIVEQGRGKTARRRKEDNKKRRRHDKGHREPSESSSSEWSQYSVMMKQVRPGQDGMQYAMEVKEDAAYPLKSSVRRDTGKNNYKHAKFETERSMGSTSGEDSQRNERRPYNMRYSITTSRDRMEGSGTAFLRRGSETFAMKEPSAIPYSKSMINSSIDLVNASNLMEGQSLEPEGKQSRRASKSQSRKPSKLGNEEAEGKQSRRASKSQSRKPSKLENDDAVLNIEGEGKQSRRSSKARSRKSSKLENEEGNKAPSEIINKEKSDTQKPSLDKSETQTTSKQKSSKELASPSPSKKGSKKLASPKVSKKGSKASPSPSKKGSQKTPKSSKKGSKESKSKKSNKDSSKKRKPSGKDSKSKKGSKKK